MYALRVESVAAVKRREPSKTSQSVQTQQCGREARHQKATEDVPAKQMRRLEEAEKTSIENERVVTHYWQRKERMSSTVMLLVVEKAPPMGWSSSSATEQRKEAAAS